MLKDVGVIVFRSSNWVDAVDEVVEKMEEKMDNVIRKMKLIIVTVVCVVFGCLLGMYAAKK
jgi:tetrahydromethanopterin S-methyltransferase subunit F